MREDMETPNDCHEAAFSGNVRALKDILDADDESVNRVDSMSQTPLHKAAMNGWIECVRLLIDRGSDVQATDICGCTPLHYAAANGYIEVVRYLVENCNADTTATSKKGQTPLFMARARRQTRMVAFLINIIASKEEK